jgi:hypothetical protein
VTRRLRSASIGLTIVLALGAARAHAQEHTLDVEGCEPELEASLRGALSIELTDAEPAVRTLLRDGSLTATVHCTEQSVEVRVEHHLRAQLYGQPVPTQREGQARRIAIVLGELFATAADASESDAAIDPTRPGAATVAPPSSPVLPTLLLRARAALSILGDPPALLGGGTLGVEIAPVSFLHVVIDAEAVATRRSVEAGDVDVVLVSGALALLLGDHVGPVAIHAGPIAHAGASVLAGTPRADVAGRGRTSIDPIVALGALGRAGVAIDRTSLRLDLELEVGAVVLGRTALALGARVITLTGAYAVLRLGIAIALF